MPTWNPFSQECLREEEKIRRAGLDKVISGNAYASVSAVDSYKRQALRELACRIVAVEKVKKLEHEAGKWHDWAELAEELLKRAGIEHPPLPYLT